MLRIRLILLLELVAVTSAVAVMAGCTSSGSADTVKVSGKITFNKSAVPGASVTFSPTGTGTVAAGTTNGQGEFELTTFTSGDGALPGDYKVLVTKSNIVQSSTATTSTADDPSAAYKAAEERGVDLSGSGIAKPGSEAAKAAPSDLLPPKYKAADTTTLSAKVEKGKDNKFTFDLE